MCICRGPKWWPFLGNGFILRELSKNLKGQHLALSKLGKDFNTSVLGLKLGRDLVVVGLSAEVIRAILTRDVFTGRPLSFFMKLRCFGKRQGITSTDGYIWKEQRAFTFRHLKQIGFGKETMDVMIMDEVKALIDALKSEKITENINEKTSLSVLNVLWALVTGKRLKKADDRLKRLLKLLSCRARAFDMAGGTLNQMPWLRYIAPQKTGYSLLQEVNSELRCFLMETIENYKKETNDRDTLIGAFLHEQKNQRNSSNFTDEQLIVILLDLFLGGAQTTSQTLNFAFLLMIRNPEVQEKVHRHIVDTIGRDNLPTVEDKSKLAYVDAVLLEVMRMYCVVPIIGPRRSLENTVLNGYFIPKNTTMLLNINAAHYDETHFSEPFKFKPERFLSSNGQLINQEGVFAFGLGKRRCLGEALARSCLFLIFSGIMQNFEITKLPNEPDPSLEPLGGITIAPKSYKAHFRWR
ncbi:hypothetical protein RUM43_003010 [Polyplax serrata]|uniref:Cytochrome P450 n=1 Tax=Polyplax serrata TaxID=468196 RepID=A0AAN8Q075_POLSC